MRRDPFLTLARDNGLEPLWTVIGRTARDHTGEEAPSDIRVRYNGLLWLEGEEAKMAHWSNDD